MLLIFISRCLYFEVNILDIHFLMFIFLKLIFRVYILIFMIFILLKSNLQIFRIFLFNIIVFIYLLIMCRSIFSVHLMIYR